MGLASARASSVSSNESIHAVREMALAKTAQGSTEQQYVRGSVRTSIGEALSSVEECALSGDAGLTLRRAFASFEAPPASLEDVDDLECWRWLGGGAGAARPGSAGAVAMVKGYGNTGSMALLRSHGEEGKKERMLVQDQ